MTVIHNTDYTPTFWNGHRQADAIRINDYAGDLAEVRDFQQFAHMYYRRFNDGDVPNPARFKRLARITGIDKTEDWDSICWGPWESNDLLDRIGEALMDRALNAIETAETPTDRAAFRANPLRVAAIWAAAIIEEGNRGDTITAAELIEEVETLRDTADYPALRRLADAVATI